MSFRKAVKEIKKAFFDNMIQEIASRNYGS